MEGTQHPLILVFYLQREMMKNSELVTLFAESVNEDIAIKEANIMAYFLPTDGQERIECINPVQVSETDMVKINAMVNEISKRFDVGQTKDEDESN